MGLNIKNEGTVALIRELAARTGQTQTGAVDDAVRSKIAQLDSADAGADAGARRASAHRLLAELHASMTPRERAAVRAADAEMYDERGLPR